MIAYRDIADTQRDDRRRHALQARGGHRRRPARAGGGQRPDAARHAGAPWCTSMPWLMERQLDDVAGELLQQSLEARGLKFLIGAQTRRRFVGDDDGRVHGRAVQGRPRGPGRPGGDGHRHPPEHRAGREDRPALPAAASSSATRCRPSPTRASTRWANAPRTAASPTAWWRRCSSRARSAPRTWPQFGIGRYTGSQTSTKLKVTGIDLFSAGNFTRRRRALRGDRA